MWATVTLMNVSPKIVVVESLGFECAKKSQNMRQHTAATGQ